MKKKSPARLLGTFWTAGMQKIGNSAQLNQNIYMGSETNLIGSEADQLGKGLPFMAVRITYSGS